MTKRILFFESDAGFAADVAERLRRHGAEVEVTDDGNAGVDAAAQNRPDLILLTIELPQVNGFLVCKKLKKSPETASIPIIILSSEATEEIFEQHRKLRTRAEDYLRKPLDLDTLIEHVRAIVPLDPVMMADDPSDEVIAISEELEVSFDQAQGTDLHQAKTVDPDIDAFADSAFDALVVGEEEHTTVGQMPAALVQSLRAAAAKSEESPPPPPPVPVAAATRAPTTPPPAMPAVGNAELERKVRDAEAAVVRAENRARLAEEQAAAAGQMRQDIERLQKEVADSKRSASIAPPGGAKGGGVSSREFLDLRESLNKKDKENLDLRDQLSARDKQMFELRDKNLGFERSIADAQDKQIELERAVADLSDQLAALAADKDAAQKRADDFKSRAERGETRIKKLESDLESETAVRAADAARLGEELKATVDALKAQHKTTVESAQSEHESALEALRTGHANALDGLHAEHASALDGLRAEHASSVDTVRAEHASAIDTVRAEHASAMDTVRAEHASALDTVRAEHTGAMEALEAEHKSTVEAQTRAGSTALESLRESLTASLESERAAHASERSARASEQAAHASAIETLQAEHASVLASTTANHESATEALTSSHAAVLAEREATHASEKTSAIEALREELSEAHAATLAALRAELTGAHTASSEEAAAKHAAAIEESNRKHGAELAAIGRKLAESENTITVTAESLSEREAELAAMTTAFEDTKASAARAGDEAKARIASLEAELEKARGKITGDGQILDRARRALEISLALLEDQKTNGISG